ncbi:MAG: twin-arginine translocation signal domain-containing protein [Clostridia bacterium]
MSERAKRLSRRNFLLTVGAGGVASAAAVVATKNSTPSQPDSQDKRATRGYQASEHVNNYYRTTKV